MTAAGLALLALGPGPLAAQEDPGAVDPRPGEDCGPEMSAREAVWIVGTVQDAGAEVRLPGAEVTMTWQVEEGVRTRSTATDGEGVYRFCGLDPGSRVTLRATVSDRGGVAVPVDVPGGEAAVRQDLEVLLSEGGEGRIVGRVIDRETGAGVEAVQVRVAPDGLQAVTDRRGRFVLQALPSGERALQLRHVAYGEHETEVEVQEGRTADVTIAVSETPVEMEASSMWTGSRRAYGTDVPGPDSVRSRAIRFGGRVSTKSRCPMWLPSRSTGGRPSFRPSSGARTPAAASSPSGRRWGRIAGRRAGRRCSRDGS